MRNPVDLEMAGNTALCSSGGDFLLTLGGQLSPSAECASRARGSRRRRRGGWGVGRGVPLPTRGEVWGGGCAPSPSPEIFFRFLSSKGEFWCILLFFAVD